jgi:arylsulfatase A-like enzyme
MRPCFPPVLSLLLVAALAAGADPRPNILLVIVDDLGVGEPGCYGGTEIPTPAIDRIAAAGVRFTSGYVTASFCAASRAGLLTGRYQTRFGFENNIIGAANDDPDKGLPAGQATLADHLRNAGYATGLVGKWHLGGAAPYHPEHRGFDSFFGFLHEGHYFVPPPWEGHVTWLRRKLLPDGGEGRWKSSDGRVLWSSHMGNNEPAYDSGNPLLRSSQPVLETENLTDAFSREAARFIERHNGQPWFLTVAYNAVHSPMQAADDYWNKHTSISDPHRRIFAAMLSHLDDGIDRLLRTLEATGQTRDTLLFFLSDNGGPTRELTSSNRPYRDGKGTLFEGGLRVPFLVQWPAVLEAGKVEHRMVSSLDIAPTALAAARIPAPDDLDGMDMTPALRGGDSDRPLRETHYWRMGKQAAFRQGHWKIVRPRGQYQWQLYNLDSDPGEQDDLSAAATRQELLRELVSAWEEFDSQMQPPRW